MDNFEAANEPQRQPEMVVSKCWECGEEKECIEYIVCCTGTKLYICPECEKNIQEEIGDILFTLNSFAQLSKLDMLDCLDQANNKFEKRFKILKKHADLENIDLKFVSSEIKEKLWEKAKKN